MALQYVKYYFLFMNYYLKYYALQSDNSKNKYITDENYLNAMNTNTKNLYEMITAKFGEFSKVRLSNFSLCILSYELLLCAFSFCYCFGDLVFGFWERRAPNNDNNPPHRITNITDMGSVSFKKP